MDFEYMRKHNLMEAHKQFMHLSEGYFAQSLGEADDEEGEQQGQNPQGGMDQMGGDPNAQGGMPSDAPGMMGGDPNGQGGMDPMGGDPSAQGGMPGDAPGMTGEDPNGQGGMDPMGGDPGMMGGDPNAEGGMPDMGPMGGEDELDSDVDEDVLDVEDLTQAQEKVYDKENMIGKDISGVDKNVTQLQASFAQMMQVIKANQEEIKSLKSELEKRVPTQTERLNLRSLDSYPFNVSPKDFWEKRGGQGDYAVRYDNNAPTSEQEHVLTVDDVQNYDDQEIADSFNLKNILKY